METYVGPRNIRPNKGLDIDRRSTNILKKGSTERLGFQLSADACSPDRINIGMLFTVSS